MHIDCAELKRLAIAAQNDCGDYVALNDYGMAMPPAVCLALIAENEALRSKSDGQHHRDSIEMRSLCQQRDQIKAENEALRKAVKQTLLAMKRIYQAGYDRVIDAGGACDTPEYMMESDPTARELRALLDADHIESPLAMVAPAVERQEPDPDCEWCGGCGHDPYGDQCVGCAQSEVATLQSTIAQLQARVQELESGRGEPVAWQYRVSAGPATGWSLWHDGKGDEFRNSYRVENRPLFTSPPVTVAVADKYDDVLLPFLSLMRAELHANAHKGDRPGWLHMDRKTAVLEVFYHMGKLHQAVHRDETAAIKEYAADVANMCMMLLDVCACLDATAALNNKPTTKVKQ